MLATYGGKNQPAPHDFRHDGQALVLMTCEHTPSACRWSGAWSTVSATDEPLPPFERLAATINVATGNFDRRQRDRLLDDIWEL